MCGGCGAGVTGEGAGPAPHRVTLPSPWALGGQQLIPFFLQGLLEERDNQVFFGEVGRQMVTGLMTRAEKVAGVGLFHIFLPMTFPSETLFLTGVCFVLLTVDWLCKNNRLEPMRWFSG